MIRLNKPKELLLKDIWILMSSYAKSEKEYNNKRVNFKIFSRKKLISYIFF
jgi:hypothetical protein